MTPSQRLNQFSDEDRKNLLEMKRQLRRLKRRLFLQAAKKPETPVEKFRAFVFNLAVDESLTTAETNTSQDSSSTLPSVSEVYEAEVRICEPVGWVRRSSPMPTDTPLFFLNRTFLPKPPKILPSLKPPFPVIETVVCISQGSYQRLNEIEKRAEV